MRFAIVVGLILLLSTSAFAAGIAKDIGAYNAISVGFSEHAKRCHLENAAGFADRLREGLSKIGVPEDRSAPVRAHLAISGNDFGVLDSQCVIEARLDFQVILTREEIEIAETVTNRAIIVSYIDQIEEIPVVLYDDGYFAVGWGSQAEDEVMKMIDKLVAKFASER